MKLSSARLLYELGWKAAKPFVSRFSRTERGYEQRALNIPLPRADLWIQAASLGESYLAIDLLSNLPCPRPMRALVTTNTGKGFELLTKGLAGPLGEEGRVTARAAYFPLDAPSIMDQAVNQVSPRLMVLLETELWPGLLAACRGAGVPVGIVNARMSPTSLSRYLLWPGLWKMSGPEFVMAVSEADARRFAMLVGKDKVTVMGNMKFDRVGRSGPLPYVKNPLAAYIRPKAPFLVLGSVRRSEEADVLEALKRVYAERPHTITGLFPRHAQRFNHWQVALTRANIPWLMRSNLDGPVPPGSVVIWDVFGELSSAYHLARAVFVGGSLRPAGGQNFLEPLAAGVIPCVGPHWDNFAWVGREIFEQKLAVEVGDARELAEWLLDAMTSQPDREGSYARFLEYVETRSGATAAAGERMAEILFDGGKA